MTRYKLKEIMNIFCIDIDATKAAVILGMKRKTINRYYGAFRRLIFNY